MIIIHPFSRKLISGKKNPKDYPDKYWEQIVDYLNDKEEIIQIGTNGDKKFVPNCIFDAHTNELRDLLLKANYFISIDSFLPHMAKNYNLKGIVIFGQSSPNIFGYPENINLLKDPKYLRENQFLSWEKAIYKENVFVKPEVVIEAIKYIRNSQSSK